jgi:hypothetical protein
MQLGTGTDDKAVCSCEQHGFNPLTGVITVRAIGSLSIMSGSCVTSSEQILKLKGEGHRGRCSSGTCLSIEQRSRPKGN